ncbi:MAG: LysM domain-containing protein [Myxococcota bacterium]
MKVHHLLATLALLTVACDTPEDQVMSTPRADRLDIVYEVIDEEIEPLAEQPAEIEEMEIEEINPETEAVAAAEMQAGPEIIGEAEMPPPTVEIMVRDGENLALLASWAEMTVEEIAERNDLAVTGVIYPGQTLQLAIADEEAFEDARAEATGGRLQRYLERRGGEISTIEHTVRTGETAWGIARDVVGVPMWVLALYNPSVDLDRLTIGQTLMAPQLGDTVADDTLPEDPELEGPEFIE